jgi:protein TonB
MRRSLAASCAIHAAVLALLLVLARVAPPQTARVGGRGALIAPRLVFLHVPGPGGGGGGGGNEQQEPPRRAEQPGRDARTVRVAPPTPSRAPSSTVDRDPAQLHAVQLNLPVQPSDSGLASISGAVESVSSSTTPSLGPGSDGGAGSGKGTGDGPGMGSGLGDGEDQGTGGKKYRIGDGVTPPIELRHGMPHYTPDAMRARLQGVVLIECIVETNGQCSGTRVVRGLDPSFGLNEEAVKAADQWRFRPGTRFGTAVPVIVTMEITFSLR